MSDVERRAGERDWAVRGDPSARIAHIRQRLRSRPGVPIALRVCYWGPPLGGKTRSFEELSAAMAWVGVEVSELTSTAHEGDRDLRWSFALRLYEALDIRVELATAPGSVYFERSRRRGLEDADALVFVARPELEWHRRGADRRPSNLHLKGELERQLFELGLEGIPIVYMWNHPELGIGLTSPELEAELNPEAAPTFEACARSGVGLFPPLIAALRRALNRRLAPDALDLVEDADLARALGLASEDEREGWEARLWLRETAGLTIRVPELAAPPPSRPAPSREGGLLRGLLGRLFRGGSAGAETEEPGDAEGLILSSSEP